MKLRVIYTPEGGSKREWEINLQNPAWDVTSQTEKVTDWPWEDFVDRLQRQSAIALQALLWVLRKRDEPKLALSSVTPDMDEIDFAAQCPKCQEWISTADADAEDGHECPDDGHDEPEAEADPEA